VDEKTARKAQELISRDEVQAVLSEPLSYDSEKIQEKNAVLQKHGFKLLSKKALAGLVVQQTIPFYSVIEHDELDGWVIKSGATRIPENKLLMGPGNDKNEMALFTKEESILRIEMAKRVAKIAQESHIEVIIPQKKLVAYSKVQAMDDVCKKYCVVCEKINILTVDETVQMIKNMDAERQKEVARNISTIVKKAGFVDASFHNIRLTPEGKLAIIDTEPAGLMVAQKPGLWNKFFGAKGASVEKCARIGLFNLMHETSKASRGTANLFLFDGLQVEQGLEAFREQVKSDYEKVSSPKLSRWKITLSAFSLGLIPLVNVIVALVKTHMAKKAHEKLQSIDQTFQLQSITLRLKTPEEQKSAVEDYREKRFPFVKKFFAQIEGVPYRANMAFA
jgi:hypothetical protein